MLILLKVWLWLHTHLSSSIGIITDVKDNSLSSFVQRHASLKETTQQTGSLTPVIFVRDQSDRKHCSLRGQLTIQWTGDENLCQCLKTITRWQSCHEPLAYQHRPKCSSDCRFSTWLWKPDTLTRERVGRSNTNLPPLSNAGERG